MDHTLNMEVGQLLKGLRRFGRAPPAKRALAVEAGIALMFFWLLSRFLPVRLWVRFFCTESKSCQDSGLARSKASDSNSTHKVGRIVGKVVRYLPLHIRCLPQAMAAYWMLRRRCVPSVLVFGVRRRADAKCQLEYHAWLMVDGECIVGGDELETFTAFPPFAVK